MRVTLGRYPSTRFFTGELGIIYVLLDEATEAGVMVDAMEVIEVVKGVVARVEREAEADAKAEAAEAVEAAEVEAGPGPPKIDGDVAATAAGFMGPVPRWF